MAQFLAITSRGLNDVLFEEVKEMGIKRCWLKPEGVYFEGSWKEAYKVNYYSRIASRVLKPLLDFPAYQPEELYQNIQKHDFTKYITPNETLAIEAKVRESKFQDQRFVALKIKDAVVDQFTEKFGKRPDVDNKKPDLNLMVRVVKNQVSVSLDLSGGSLAYRGYRISSTIAPLRENLAAGLLRMTGWSGDMPLMDPMCGSGTFSIEAAYMGMGIPAGRLKKRFGFHRLKFFDEKVWNEVTAWDVTSKKLKIFASDKSRECVDASQGNASKANVVSAIKWQTAKFEQLKAPSKESGIIIMNPPYGTRLEDVDKLRPLYHTIGEVVKERFQGWTLWLLSGEESLTKELHMKAAVKHNVWNGNIECRFLKYEIR